MSRGIGKSRLAASGPLTAAAVHRFLAIVHRYVGMAIGILMTMWCLSGMVMMYVSYPVLSESTRVAALAPLNPDHCCSLPANALPEEASVPSFQLEMLGSRPVLRLARDFGPPRIVDLESGAPIERVCDAEAASVASGFAVRASPKLQASIEDDQWTLSGIRPSERPLLRFTLDDSPVDTHIYVSTVTGRAVQLTTAHQRLWNWLGAIPHWLYFSQLRRNTTLWTNVVVYSSTVGVFLAFFGLYLGVDAFIRNPGRRWSAFRGWLLWHHLPGLIFGWWVLTWITSGLLSMNPWGWLDSEGAASERQEIQGELIKASQVRVTLAALKGLIQSGDILSLRSAPLDGRLYVIATTALGQKIRFDSRGTATPLTHDEIATIGRTIAELATTGGNATDPAATAKRARLDGPAPSPEWITREDDYYFSHHTEIAQLPAYRLVLDDPQHTRYYFDAISGELVRKIDRPARGYRWLHEGLHRMDFTATLRSRPIWDFVMWVLLLGVTTTTLTGTWLGIRRMLPITSTRRR